MITRPLSSSVLCIVAGTLLLSPELRAQSARDTGKQSPSSAARSGSTARTAAKGALPDPVLLDGSNQPAEKRPDQGMIGEFELPGDENVRNQRVGGQQGQQGGQQQQQQGGGQQGMAGMQGGGAGGQQNQQGGGQQQQQGQGSSNAVQGEGDPNAKAEGMQVAQLEGDQQANDGSGGGQPGQKPPPVSIGDKAMQIKSVPNPNVVGSQQQQASNAQQMEKAVGGGKGSSQIPAGRNASERGRVMPSGL